MKKDDDEDKVCEYCRRAIHVADTGDMLCEKRGVVPGGFSCRRFVYDPLKRVPRRMKILIPDEIITDI